MADKPQAPNLTFSTLDAIEGPTPFVYTTKAGKRVTFPDLFDLEFEEAEEFLADVGRTQSNTAVLKKWLSEDDYEKLRADKLSLRQVTTLVESVQHHYEASVGTPGEDAASAN